MTDKTLTVRISAEDHGKIIWKLEQLADACENLAPPLAPPNVRREDQEAAAHFRALAEAMRSGVVA